MLTRALPVAEIDRQQAMAMRLDCVKAQVAITRLYSVVPLALLSAGVGIAMGAARVQVMAASIAVAAAVAGGYAYNDLRDQQPDGRNRPRRPLVSGRLTAAYVRSLVAGLFGSAMLLALATWSWRTVAFIALLIASSCLYSDRIKYVPGLKNAFVALWCGLLPWGASLDAMNLAASLPAIAIVAMFIAQKELIADVYDLDGDVAAGVATIPSLVGVRLAVVMVASINVGSLLMLRLMDGAQVLTELPAAAAGVATVNVLALLLVFCRITSFTVRAFLEMQKVFLIGGCLALFVALVR
jgi:4-hydroxybenzoate polyprenyltransferase